MKTTKTLHSKVVQFQFVNYLHGTKPLPQIFALCEDGSLWHRDLIGEHSLKWVPFSEPHANTQVKESTCSACNGFGSEMTVYDGKIPCRECKPQKVDEKTRADLWCPR